MTPSSPFDRIAACGGLAFTVFGLVSGLIAPAAPAMDASAAEVRRYLVDNHDRFGLSAMAMALALLGITLAFGHIHRRLAETDEGTSLPSAFLAAAASTATLALAGVLLQGVLARHGGSGLDDSTLLALHRAWNMVAFMGPALPVTVALLLAGERTIRRGVFPRWLGWVAVVSGFGGLATALINLGTSAKAPAVLDFGSFLLTCVWLSGIAVSALLAPRTAAATA